MANNGMQPARKNLSLVHAEQSKKKAKKMCQKKVTTKMSARVTTPSTTAADFLAVMHPYCLLHAVLTPIPTCSLPSPFQLSLHLADPSNDGLSDHASSYEGRGPDSPPRMAKERTYPRLRHPATTPALLACSWSALRYIMLQQRTGSSSGSTGAGSAAVAAVAAPGSPSKLARLLGRAISRPAITSAAAAGQAAGTSTAAAPASAAGSIDQGSVAGNADQGSAAVRVYGDGPIWAAAALLQLSGQARAYALCDVSAQLCHRVEYEQLGGSCPAPSHAMSATAGVTGPAPELAKLAAANAKADQVWQHATSVLSRRFQPTAAAPEPIRFQALGDETPLVCGPDPNPLATVGIPSSQLPIRVTQVRKGARGNKGPMAAAAGPAAAAAGSPQIIRPKHAPAKAGMVDAARAASVVRRFMAAAPPSVAVTSSARRERGSSVATRSSARSQAAVAIEAGAGADGADEAPEVSSMTVSGMQARRNRGLLFDPVMLIFAYEHMMHMRLVVPTQPVK